jgi:CheY-like chemotaxis protein
MAIILCVDGPAAGLAILEAFFDAKGYTVITATDGVAAINVAEQHAVDMVVLDYHTPGMSVEETARLKSRHPKLAIILLTHFATEVPEQLLQVVDACVQKGEASVLLSTLEKFRRSPG